MNSTALFFNTAIESNCLLENAGNALLTPVRILFSGKVYSLKSTGFEENAEEASPIRRTISIALSILFIIPLCFVGMIVKGLSQLRVSVRERSENLLHYLETPKPPEPPARAHELPFFTNEESYLEAHAQLSDHTREVDARNLTADDAKSILSEVTALVTALREKMPLQLGKMRAIDFDNMGKNRYSNISPYDYNIPEHVPYINASKIVFEGIPFIAAQAPQVVHIANTSHYRVDTLSEFIDMTLASGSKTIVTLLNTAEKGKADDYWSLPTKLSLHRMLVPEEQVALMESPRGERLVRRTLAVRDADGNVIERITQFHYEHWRDQSPPNEELFHQFLDALEKHEEKGPLVTHCSAGVGRTGTFIAALGLRKSIREKLQRNPDLKPTINIAQAMLELRLQRDMMIQTEDQYVAIHTAIRMHYLELTS